MHRLWVFTGICLGVWLATPWAQASALRTLSYRVDTPHQPAFVLRFTLSDAAILYQSRMLGTQQQRDRFYQEAATNSILRQTGTTARDIFLQSRDALLAIRERAIEQVPSIVININHQETQSKWRLGYSIPAQQFTPRNHAIAQRYFEDVRLTYAEYERRLDAYESQVQAIRSDPAFRQTLDRLFDQRFFTRTDSARRKVHIDYARIAQTTAASLSSLAQAIRLFRDPSERTLIQRVLSFMQSLDYDNLNSRTDDQAYRGGFFPPALLLNQGRGDCDIKTTAMAALLTHLLPGKRMAIVLLPQHALLGVSIPQQYGDEILQYQGKTYVLMEPVGPAYTKVGTVSNDSLVPLRGGGIRSIATF